MRKRAKPPTGAKPSNPHDATRPSRAARRRETVRALVRRLHQRTDSVLRHRRKAGLAFSAGAMGITAAAIGVPPAPPASATALSAPMPEVRKLATLLHCSQALKESLIQEEGVRDVVYRDVAGHPTVGVGHLVRPEDGLRVGDRVSYDRILDFLEDDLQVAERAAARVAGDLPLFQHEFDALVDLVYNVGEGNLSWERSPRLNRAIAERDYEAIADELHYTHAAGVPANGLVYRSERRSNIFLDASYQDPREPV